MKNLLKVCKIIRAHRQQYKLHLEIPKSSQVSVVLKDCVYKVLLLVNLPSNNLYIRTKYLKYILHKLFGFYSIIST